MRKVIQNEVNLVQADYRDQLAQLFARVDSNGDGTLSAEDFGASKSAQWDMIQNVFDYNKDGSVTAQEFIAYFIADTWKEYPVDENFLMDPRYAGFNSYLAQHIQNFAAQFPDDMADL